MHTGGLFAFPAVCYSLRMKLSSKQRAFLRKLGQSLHATVTVGKEGVTPEVIEFLERNLEHHELVKVKWLKTSPEETTEMQEKLSSATRSTVAGSIGRTLLLFRKSSTQPKIDLPAGDD